MSNTSSRRHWLASASAMGVAGIVAAACGSASRKGSSDEEEVAPPEDLMREHALLNRILLVYDEAVRTLKDPAQATALASALRQFIRMYRPHEAREDTVLFPAIRDIVSKEEFAALGEDFEKKEHQLFGEDGFEKRVGQVAAIEKSIGLYELAQFTP